VTGIPSHVVKQLLISVWPSIYLKTKIRGEPFGKNRHFKKARCRLTMQFCEGPKCVSQTSEELLKLSAIASSRSLEL
jgi:hypothetical protein